jgi:hypothetical protein
MLIRNAGVYSAGAKGAKEADGKMNQKLLLFTTATPFFSVIISTQSSSSSFK